MIHEERKCWLVWKDQHNMVGETPDELWEMYQKYKKSSKMDIVRMMYIFCEDTSKLVMDFYGFTNRRSNNFFTCISSIINMKESHISSNIGRRLSTLHFYSEFSILDACEEMGKYETMEELINNNRITMASERAFKQYRIDRLRKYACAMSMYHHRSFEADDAAYEYYYGDYYDDHYDYDYDYYYDGDDDDYDDYEVDYKLISNKVLQNSKIKNGIVEYYEQKNYCDVVDVVDVDVFDVVDVIGAVDMINNAIDHMINNMIDDIANVMIDVVINEF